MRQMAVRPFIECRCRLTLTLLFWNLKQKPLRDCVGSLAEAHSAEFVLLAESAIQDDGVVQSLNSRRRTGYRRLSTFTGVSRLRAYSTYTRRQCFPVFEDLSERLVIYRLVLKKIDLLIGIVHLASKAYFREDDQISEAQRIASEVRIVEKEFGHRRTILIGDFNLNPFDPGMIASHGFHAVMDRRIAMSKTRKVQSVDYPFFYNPIWGRLGDETPGPAGTHFYRNSNPIVYFWNAFDQALVRPDVLECSQAELSILTTDGNVILADANGRPDAVHFSDHFPILFRLPDFPNQ